MPRVPKNLSLDRDVVRKAERYASRHQVSLSQLVSDFLEHLTERDEARGFSPAVERLVGVAKGSRGVEDYHEYLEAKYPR
jgi:hypothetical protein